MPAAILLGSSSFTVGWVEPGGWSGVRPKMSWSNLSINIVLTLDCLSDVKGHVHKYITKDRTVLLDEDVVVKSLHQHCPYFGLSDRYIDLLINLDPLLSDGLMKSRIESAFSAVAGHKIGP